MQIEPELLSPHAIQEVINLAREGRQVSLVCHRRYPGFTPAMIYPLQKIVGGKGIGLRDDNNEEVTLTQDCEALGCFVIAEGLGRAKEIADKMQEELLVRLASQVVRFNTKNTFRIGDVVMWKDGMAVSTVPAPGQAAVVIEMLDTPLVSNDGHPLDPVRTLRCDMVIACESPDHNTLVTVHADSRRFEMYPYQVQELSQDLANL